MPVLNRWKILSPETPIIITQRQEIRTSDSGDVFTAIDGVKSKISLLVSTSGSDLKVLGGALNLTSDGWFVAVQSSVGTLKPEDMKIKLDDGTFSQVVKTVADPATHLVFLQTSSQGIPAVKFGSSSQLQPGEKVVFVLASTYDHQVSDSLQTVTKNQLDAFHVILRANNPSRTFGVSQPTDLVPGEAAVNMAGEVVGMADGSGLISSDIIKNTTDRFLSSNATLSRPDFGFAYKMVTASEHTALNMTQGAEVVNPSATEPGVVPASPAQKAGVKVGDVITAVNGSAVSEGNPLEVVLQQFKTGDVLTLTITRAGAIMTLPLTVGTLQ